MNPSHKDVVSKWFWIIISLFSLTVFPILAQKLTCVVQVAFNVFIQAANSNLLPMKLETFQHRAKQNVRKGMKVVVTRSSTYLY